MRPIGFMVFLLALAGCAEPELPPVTMQEPIHAWDPFLDTVQTRTIRYFLETTDSLTGLALDRYPSPSPASIAAVGYALTTYPIAAERGILTREQAARRAFNTLKYFCSLPQDSSASASGYHGFFYHFLRTSDGRREFNCELSTIDTGLLLAGVLFCQSYFTGPSGLEPGIRSFADALYRRVDWTWASEGKPGISMGWDPQRKFHRDSWHGYNEAMIVYILGFGSPTHPAPPEGWQYWCSTYVWGKYFGLEFLSFGPLFGHQYSHCWIDFRGRQDPYMRSKAIDYFENSRRATYTQQAYAKYNPDQCRDYTDLIWGFTACDGPGDTSFTIDQRRRRFQAYSARGVSMDWTNDDGTIAPTAATASIPFAPEICLPTVKAIADRYGARLFRDYGFADAFNPTFITPHTPQGWVDKDYLGIDQGPIVIMIENYRNGLVWETMKKNPYVIAGLKKAGFTGGWLSAPH